MTNKIPKQKRAGECAMSYYKVAEDFDSSSSTVLKGHFSIS